MTGIYQIINKINDHAYVGSAVDIKRRWAWHKSRLNKGKHYNPYLQHAWNKYGKENFEFSMVEKIVEKSLLLKVEQSYLDNLKLKYNMSPTAGGGDQGEEARRKISLASKGNKSNLGRCFSEDHKRRIGESNKGKRKGFLASEETKKKMQEAHSGEKHHFYGKHLAEETKRKISATLKRNNSKEIN